MGKMNTPPRRHTIYQCWLVQSECNGAAIKKLEVARWSETYFGNIEIGGAGGMQWYNLPTTLTSVFFADTGVKCVFKAFVTTSQFEVKCVFKTFATTSQFEVNVNDMFSSSHYEIHVCFSTVVRCGLHDDVDVQWRCLIRFIELAAPSGCWLLLAVSGCC